MKMSEVTVDPDRLENGAWVDDIPEMEGLRLKVRGSQNSDWRRHQAKMLEAVPRKRRIGGRVDQDDMDRIVTSCLLNCCLLDWEGLEEDDGKPIPYSKQMAEQLLKEPQFRRFRDGVVYAASIVSENLDIDKKDISGNLLTLSAGSTGGERKSKAG
jgi:hypothetical protein